jgi:hypothetical protein
MRLQSRQPRSGPHPLAPQVRSWIDEALSGGGAVLVHCFEGRSRSVTLVAAYLLLSDSGLDLATALARIRRGPLPERAAQRATPVESAAGCAAPHNPDVGRHRPRTRLPAPPRRSVRPGACPNPGFVAALLDLEEATTGRRSVLPRQRGKPAPRVCGLCGAPVGVSIGSLAVHMRAQHPQQRQQDGASQGAGN